MSGHDPEKLKAFWEYCEAFKGWAKLLIVGNAAGLGYCLTTLNTPNPKYNVGAFIALFGGVLLGGLYFLILTILKAEVTTAIVTQQPPGRALKTVLIEVLGHVGMWGSAAAFAAGILLFAYRFWPL